MKDENRSEEVTMSDLLGVLQRYKSLLIGLPVGAALLSFFLVSFVLRPTWEASALLEIGHVGMSGQAGQNTYVLVEPVANVVSRMMLPSFAKGALKNAGIQADETAALSGFYKTLKVTPVKGSELLEVKLRAESAEQAKVLIQGGIANLQQIHSEMMAVSIGRYKKQFQLLNDDIQKTSAEIDLLKKKLLATHDWNAFDATLSASLLRDRMDALRAMHQNKLMLEEQLSLSRTFTTRVVDEISVSEGPVSPNKPLIVALAILLGLAGAVFWAFIHNAAIRKH